MGICAEDFTIGCVRTAEVRMTLSRQFLRLQHLKLSCKGRRGLRGDMYSSAKLDLLIFPVPVVAFTADMCHLPFAAVKLQDSLLCATCS